MILSKTVKIRVKGNNIKHLKKLQYKNLKCNELIEIPIEHLSKGSHAKIKVKCDICDSEKELSYFKYLKNIKNYNIYACSPKCAQIKTKKTLLKKYGVEHHFQLKEFLDKRVKTYIENYGTESPLQNDIIKIKVINTNLKKYGVTNSNKLEITKNKIKNTKKIKYSDCNYNNRKQAKKTCFERYGNENFVNPEKTKQTNLKRYGVENVSYDEKIIKKIIEAQTGLLYEEYIKQLPDYKKYRREVDIRTRKQPLYLLKNYEKRGRKKDSYWVDHKFSIMEGFRQNIDTNIIGNIINLEMLFCSSNISKLDKCSITKEELFEKFDKRDKILEQLINQYNQKQK